MDADLVDTFKVVDVWVGLFISPETFDDYLSENYSGEDDPISRFAADQGQSFYDHDFLQAAFTAPTHDPTALLEDFVAVPGGLGVGPINALILAYGMQIHEPRSASGEGYQLYYLGQFPATFSGPPTSPHQVDSIDAP